MRTIFRIAAVTMLLALLPIAAFAQKHELAVTVGGNFPRNDQYNTQKSFAVGGQYDGRIFKAPLMSLYVDVPLVVATRSSFTDPTCASPCTVGNNYRSFFFTPGLKLKFGAPLIPFAPYVVAGVGLAHYNVTGSSFTSSSSNKAAFEVGGGMDMKVAPFFSIRGEVRDFINGSPELAAITASGHQHNIVPQVGLVFRF